MFSDQFVNSNIEAFISACVFVWFIQLAVICAIFKPRKEMIIYPIFFNFLFGCLSAFLICVAPLLFVGVILFFLFCYYFCRVIVFIFSKKSIG